MKSIDTIYKGYKFRSRLEARYAVFFDVLGIRWEYEVEGYVFEDGGCYLPDFWLPSFNGGMYVEVKAEDFSTTERELCWKLCDESQFGVWLAKGKPDFTLWEVFYYVKGEPVMGDGIPCFGRFKNRMFAMPGMGKPGEVVSPVWHTSFGKKYKSAVEAAKQARFEHGEKP